MGNRIIHRLSLYKDKEGNGYVPRVFKDYERASRLGRNRN